jgi:predicted aldo/keto reductase-like oxidoreductase
MKLDYLDFFQVWGLNDVEMWTTVNKPGGFVEGIKRAMDEGLVKHTGLTTHLLPEDLNPMLEQAGWCEVVLLGYNFLDRRREESLALAKKLGIGTLVMNPVAGGKLAGTSPVLQEIVDKAGAESLPDLAIRYVLANPNVDSSVCGMTRMSDIDDSIASADRGPLTAEQVKMVNEFMGARSRENAAFCNACEYCLPCPEGIKIPAIMACIYEDRYLGLADHARRMYNSRGTGEVKAEACTACRQCEEKCPQGLKIADEMQYALANYAKEREEADT